MSPDQVVVAVATAILMATIVFYVLLVCRIWNGRMWVWVLWEKIRGMCTIDWVVTLLFVFLLAVCWTQISFDDIEVVIKCTGYNRPRERDEEFAELAFPV